MLQFSKTLASVVIIIFLSFLAIGGCDSNSGGGTPAGEPFRNPEIISSVDGMLEVALNVDVSPGRVAGQDFMSLQYDGVFAPPTFVVSRGDTIFLQLNNSIKNEKSTNLHYHGMNISPKAPSDDVFIMVLSGQSFNYVVNIPGNHPQGMFYYHSHLFGLTEFQIMSGLSGGLMVDGLLDPLIEKDPRLAGIKQQIIYLKDIQLMDGEVPPEGMIDPSAPTNFTVNGQTNPVLMMRPGETQFWTLLNIGADLYYFLTLEDHVFFQIERDGNRFNQTLVLDELLIPTSSRFGVLVQAGGPGVYELKANQFNTGPAGDSYGGATLLTVVVEGEPVDDPIQLPIPTDDFPVIEDWCQLEVDNKRTIVFSETPDGNTFFINGKQFDPERVDTVVPIGGFEEWTIQNISEELHVFHIHLTDFQVCEINGKPQPFVGYQDTVNVPFMGQFGPGPGEVKIVINFTNPVIEGKAVYHCHIGEHEDQGMMAVFEAVLPE